MNRVKSNTIYFLCVLFTIFACNFLTHEFTAAAQENDGNGVGTGILDIVPPTLQSFSVETDSVEADGYIEMTAEASDDISGISSVSVSFYNNDYGTKISGSCYYNELPEYVFGPGLAKKFNDGKCHGIIFTYPTTKAGVYKLQSILVTDNAGNTTTYSAEDEPIPDAIAGLNITVINSLSEDKVPPTLQNFSVETDNVEANGYVEMTAEASDDNSGISSVSVSFYNSDYGRKISGSCYYNELPEYVFGPGLAKKFNDGKCHGIIFTYPSTKAGVYKLQSISVTDNAGNTTTYSAEDEPIPDAIAGLIINVTNKYSDDNEAPDIRNVTLSSTELSVPGTIIATADVVDNISGSDSLSLTFENKTYSKKISLHLGYYYYEKGVYTKSEDGLLHGTVYLNQYTRPGEYLLTSASVQDNAGNHAIYSYDDALSPLPDCLAGLSIIVNNSGAGASLVASTNTIDLASKIKEQPDETAILVDYSNNSTITGDVFDAIKGTNKTLILESSGAQWIFEGKNITGETKSIDLDVKVQSLDQTIEGDDIESIKATIGDQPTVVLTFPENGTLPGSAKIRIKADARMTNYLGQDGLYAYYVDNAIGKMVKVAENLSVTTDSYIEFDITHCSNYIIVQGELKNLTTKVSKNKKQPENGNGLPFIIKPDSSDEDEGSSDSDIKEEDNSKATSEWKPTTPDEQKRYDVVGKDPVVLTADPKNAYSLKAYNKMQGSQCFKAFESALNGYTIGRTYDILPNGKRVQEMDKEATFTLQIPKEMQKSGRDFQLICVTRDGVPVVLKDLDKNETTITVKTKKYYAFALVYKDTKSK